MWLHHISNALTLMHIRHPDPERTHTQIHTLWQREGGGWDSHLVDTASRTKLGPCRARDTLNADVCATSKPCMAGYVHSQAMESSAALEEGGGAQ